MGQGTSLLLETQGSDRRGRERSWTQGATAAATAIAQELATETKRGASARICAGKRKDRGTENRAALGRASKAGGFPDMLPGCGLSLLQRARDGSAHRQQGRCQANSIGGT